MQPIKNKREHSLGFTYIGLLLIVAIAGIALSGVGIVWKTEMQRENEKELRYAGQQYVVAIASYYECKNCGPNQLPKNLKDLLKDSRTPTVVHHIRQLYRDPMTRSNDWGLIKKGDRITGVYSKSKLEPLAKPYDLDLFNKKKNTNGVATQTNTTQTNTNSSSDNKPNQNQIGANIPDANKADPSKVDTNKTDKGKPIKPKKPSYQDWQFVYGGAAVAGTLPDVSISGAPNESPSDTPLATNSVLNEREKGRSKRVEEVCQRSYEDDILRCEQARSDGEGRDVGPQYLLCLKEAKNQFNQCAVSL